MQFFATSTSQYFSKQLMLLHTVQGTLKEHDFQKVPGLHLGKNESCKVPHFKCLRAEHLKLLFTFVNLGQPGLI